MMEAICISISQDRKLEPLSQLWRSRHLGASAPAYRNHRAALGRYRSSDRGSYSARRCVSRASMRLGQDRRISATARYILRQDEAPIATIDPSLRAEAHILADGRRHAQNIVFIDHVVVPRSGAGAPFSSPVIAYSNAVFFACSRLFCQG